MTTRCHRVGVAVGLLAVLALALAAPQPSRAGEHFRNCGKSRKLRVRIIASHVSCRKARRLVHADLRGGVGSGQEKRVRGYPGWKCSSGDRSGSFARGCYAPGTPEVPIRLLRSSRRPGWVWR
jgi:hypothetical protein